MIPLRSATLAGLSAFLACSAFAPIASAASVSLTAVADTPVFHRDGTFTYNSTNYGTAGQLDTSQFGAGIWAMSYIRFDLSSLPEGAVIESASFTVTKTTTANIAGFTVVRNDTITTGRFGSYGLLEVDGNTSQAWGETALTGNNLGAERVSGTNPQFDSNRTVDLNAATETLLNSSTAVQVSGTLVANFLQARLDALTNTALATFIVDYMEDAGSGARGFSFASKENTASLAAPTLTITYSVVPEPTVAALGGFALLGLLRRRRH
jgi:MYXO-CTERM domain-containing protein